MKKKIILKFRLIASLFLVLLLSGYVKAQCNANFTYTLGANGTATFQSTSTGTSSSTNYNWTSNSFNFSGSAAITFTFIDNQTYTVTLAITDPNATPSCSSSITQTINVTSAPCYTAINVYTTQSPNGLVNFNYYLSGPYGNSYVSQANNFWSFGDGGTSNIANPSHTYLSSGVYNVTLTASNNSAVCTYTALKTISVTVAPCSISAGYTYTIGTNGLVHFKSTSTGTLPGTTYSWSFNDNQPGVSAYSHDTISRRFLGNVTYPVSFSARYSNPFWCVDSLVQMVSISNVTACTAYSAFNLVKDTTQSLTWNLWASYPPNVTSVNWNWGDGSSSNTLYPSHTYSASGWYNICLTVSVQCGDTYSVCTGQYLYRQADLNNSNAMVTVNVRKIEGNLVGLNIASLETLKVGISPNPNNANFNLKINGFKENSVIELNLINLMGQIVFKENVLIENRSLDKTMSLEFLPSGTYFLKILSGNQNYMTKLIVTK